MAALLAVLAFAPAAVASDPPAAPTSVKAKPRVSGVDLEWSAVKGASFYKVALSPKPASSSASVGASSTSLRISKGLADSTEYMVTVTAFAEDNTAGATSKSVAFTTLAQPDPVGDPRYEAKGDNAYLVSWLPPEHNGGSDITAYSATCSAGGTHATVSTDKNTTSALVSGVPVKNDAKCNVTVSTAAGGSTKAIALAGTAGPPPGAVQDLRATGTATGLSVSWTAPVSTELAPATVRYGVTMRGCGPDVKAQTTSTRINLNVSRALCTGTLEVVPANGAGSGPVTSLEPTTGDRAPAAPYALTATPTARGTLVKWQPPAAAADGRSAVQGYKVLIIRRPGPKQSQRTTLVRKPRFTLKTGSGTPVVVLVSALNGGGEGRLSSSLSTTGGVRLGVAFPGHGQLLVSTADYAVGRVPAPRVKVRLRRSGASGGKGRVLKTGRLGRVRVGHLTPGTYVVQVVDSKRRAMGLPRRTVVVR